MANADYFFQTIEMAKSDEEYDVELCSSSAFAVERQVPSCYSWNVVKRRKQLSRCQSQNNAPPSPPAPPSTPTSLLASGTGTPASSPTAVAAAAAVSNSNEAASAIVAKTVDQDDERMNSLLYILDYAPKYKKKLKEQRRTDAELAELFNTFTITGGGSGGGSGIGKGSSSSCNSGELGLSESSRVIRKHDGSTKIFKIRRNPKEFFREPFEEDSVSAPEYDDADYEEHRRIPTIIPKFYPRRFKRRFTRFERFVHKERMESLTDNFEAAMNMNEEG